MLCPRQGSLPNREDCRFLVLSQGFRYPGGGIEKEAWLRGPSLRWYCQDTDEGTGARTV